MQVSKKPTDPADTFEKRRRWKAHLAMVNVESVSKKNKVSAFFVKTGRKKLSGKKYQNMPLNWMVFHPLVLKYKDCQADSIVYPLPSKKNPRMKFSSLITRRKKTFRRPKDGKMKDQEPVVVFKQKMDASDH